MDNIKMKTINQLFKTYKQASWRTQLQWIGLFLIVLAALGIVSAFYVNVTARTTLAGREIAKSKENIRIMQLNISDIESRLADKASAKNMRERAAAMGFMPAQPEEFIYIYVPGYTPKPAFSLAPKAAPIPAAIVLPEYTESLFDWFFTRGQP
jgi:hypothetical protein